MSPQHCGVFSMKSEIPENPNKIVLERVTVSQGLSSCGNEGMTQESRDGSLTREFRLAAWPSKPRVFQGQGQKYGRLRKSQDDSYPTSRPSGTRGMEMKKKEATS